MRVFISAVALLTLSAVAFSQDVPDRIDRSDRQFAIPVEVGVFAKPGQWSTTTTFRLGYTTADDFKAFGPSMAIRFEAPEERKGKGTSTFAVKFLRIEPDNAASKRKVNASYQVALLQSDDVVGLTGGLGWSETSRGRRIASASLGVSKASDFLGYKLTLALTSAYESVNSPSLRSDNGIVFDLAANLALSDKTSVLFDHIFKSDIEGKASWFAQLNHSLSDSYSVRITAAKDDVFTIEIGRKIKS